MSRWRTGNNTFPRSFPGEFFVERLIFAARRGMIARKTYKEAARGDIQRGKQLDTDGAA